MRLSEWHYQPRHVNPRILDVGQVAQKEHCNTRQFVAGLVICLAVSALFISIIKKDGMDYSRIVIPSDYAMIKDNNEFEEINGYRFYYYNPNPEENNSLNGYYGFPGTECKGTLEKIEMRVNTLANGFRCKPEYQKIPYDFQGKILSSDLVTIMGLEKYY